MTAVMRQWHELCWNRVGSQVCLFVISSFSVSLLCVCLHYTVWNAYTSVHNLATHMCHLPYNCHLHSQWARLRHTKVACHIHLRLDDQVFYLFLFHTKHLSPDERVAFEIADAAEWKAIVDSASVKVLDSEVANTIRKERPDRVINSRMVRRLKPQEGTFQKPKKKSRWCVLGHWDPDAADMFTYAPTPQTESIMMFLFLLQLCSLTLSVADLKNAFCQSDSLDRSAAPLFVEPCEGLDLPSGSLIQLVAPVYGLLIESLCWNPVCTCTTLPVEAWTD